MYFILEKKIRNGSFNQFGIVVAASIQEAAEILRAQIIAAVQPPEVTIAYAELEDGYSLTEMPEITALPLVEKLKGFDPLIPWEDQPDPVIAFDMTQHRLL